MDKYSSHVSTSKELNTESFTHLQKLIFEKLFCTPGGGGYPKERVVPEQRNKKILDQVKEVTHVDLVTILQNLDQDLVKGALGGAQFKELFYANCKCEKIAAAVEAIVGK